MKKITFIFVLIMVSILVDADQLKFESTIPAHSNLSERDRIKLVLTLEQPADAASVEIQDYTKRPAYLNGCRKIELTPSSDRKTFHKELTVSNFYSPIFVSGKIQGEGFISFIPLIKRGRNETRLKEEKIPWRFKPEGTAMLTTGVLPTEQGKFGSALTFDGNAAMMAVNRTKFNAEKGSVDGWFFLPLQANANEQIVFFIQSADSSPWSYHQVKVLPDSRKIQYLTYASGQVKPVHAITSQEITDEDWIYVVINYDLATKKMEFLVNGKSQGQNTYDFPVGGSIADVNIGARIHNQGLDYKIISASQMMIDEFRISDVVRTANPVPGMAFNPDDNTLLLLHFDENGILKNAVTKQ